MGRAAFPLGAPAFSSSSGRRHALARGPVLHLQSQQRSASSSAFKDPVMMMRGRLDTPGWYFKATWLATSTFPLPRNPARPQVWGEGVTSRREGHPGIERLEAGARATSQEQRTRPPAPS